MPSWDAGMYLHVAIKREVETHQEMSSYANMDQIIKEAQVLRTRKTQSLHPFSAGLALT